MLHILFMRGTKNHEAPICDGHEKERDISRGIQKVITL